jgi:hypothetical protein
VSEGAPRPAGTTLLTTIFNTLVKDGLDSSSYLVFDDYDDIHEAVEVLRVLGYKCIVVERQVLIIERRTREEA